MFIWGGGAVVFLQDSVPGCIIVNVVRDKAILYWRQDQSLIRHLTVIII